MWCTLTLNIRHRFFPSVSTTPGSATSSPGGKWSTERRVTALVWAGFSALCGVWGGGCRSRKAVRGRRACGGAPWRIICRRFLGTGGRWGGLMWGRGTEVEEEKWRDGGHWLLGIIGCNMFSERRAWIACCSMLVSRTRAVFIRRLDLSCRRRKKYVLSEENRATAKRCIRGGLLQLVGGARWYYVRFDNCRCVRVRFIAKFPLAFMLTSRQPRKTFHIDPQRVSDSHY